MSVLEDTVIFAAVIRHGGFSHAAKSLRLSNGLVSRRIAQLEKALGVSLIRRTTRQLHLTPEGELLWQHAQRIQQELDAALSLIQSLAEKPKGEIRISAPLLFGREYLTPILVKFMKNFPDIKVDLLLTNQKLDPIKENLDLIFRAMGYFDKTTLDDSTMKSKLLLKQKIGLYASHEYLLNHGEPKSPEELSKHHIIGYMDKIHLPENENWQYLDSDSKQHKMTVTPTFSCNDIDSSLSACVSGYGIGKFSSLSVMKSLQRNELRPVLQSYNWGDYYLYAMYAMQEALPKRTRMLLDFIIAHTQNLAG